MTASRRGDVVLVGFQFADESGWKHRPAVVLSSASYHRNRQRMRDVVDEVNLLRFRLCADSD
jgi:mRNA-degrading endonuclease toxin of MazEF toxin-antitoxin module